ncbi:MAG: DUF3604 domain-containing protein [Acidobacteriota bacterium]
MLPNSSRSPVTAVPRPVRLAISIALLLFSGCQPSPEASSEDAASPADRPAANPLRNPYFGDLHVHTRLSFDAYVFDVRNGPSDAYRYAKGEAIQHADGYSFQLASGPLDFQAVTDHGLYLGVVAAMEDPESPVYEEPLAQEIRGLNAVQGFQRMLRALTSNELADMDTDATQRSAWQTVVEAAAEHNDPGHFTTFIGYEYTSAGDNAFDNLHRNVIFRGADAPDLPFAASESQNPEDLWNWMDDQRSAGFDALAIPHNSNGSGGRMFELHRYRGGPLDAEYAEQRMRNEPLVEITQVKGTSEVHPLLNPNDEWADFEIYPYKIATRTPSEPDGSYVRQALVRGLVLEEQQGFNPFRFGFIGSTDSHNAGGTPEEANHVGKVGARDGSPQKRGSVPLDEPNEDGSLYSKVGAGFQFYGSAGLAGVWAEENTRESLFEAMRRKETFATSGPRIKLRFFGGYDLPAMNQADFVERAYATGVPMGADLLAEGDAAPTFVAWAVGDPDSAPLQRLQIVKGWVEEGEAKEQVFDVACADGSLPNPATHRCEDNGASVALDDCSVDGEGAPELKATWQDPSYDAARRALYYVRVLENPTCRWSTWDALRAGVSPREDIAKTIQERAWTSPIWLVPASTEN